jgi:hypothetical protein
MVSIINLEVNAFSSWKLVDCHLPFVVQVEQRNNEEGGVL